MALLLSICLTTPPTLWVTAGRTDCSHSVTQNTGRPGSVTRLPQDTDLSGTTVTGSQMARCGGNDHTMVHMVHIVVRPQFLKRQKFLRSKSFEHIFCSRQLACATCCGGCKCSCPFLILTFNLLSSLFLLIAFHPLWVISENWFSICHPILTQLDVILSIWFWL